MHCFEKIVLKSSDDEIFEVDEATARQILTPAAPLLVKDSHDVKQAAVPVKGKILAKLIEYCKKLVDGAVSSSGEYHLRKWEAEFMEVDQSTLFQIMMAADELKIQSLFDLTCKTVARMMNNKTVAELREIFNIKYDATDLEAEEEMRQEHPWAFE
ncbi:PREDICTED: SKP1-like protein 1A [Camelina sativa]|uniref:SKP1-like protein n=1 Tax=Camelina sativa TaxID=90675 RepID=A0ABM1RNY9_CAMSA|nr:PREDICTED: SKP1-like protein 1A [Camelina sativa]